MVVTLMLCGVPYHMSLVDLAFYFNKVFDTDEIGNFKAREGLTTDNKRNVALDFSSGFDAMSAQQILNGYNFFTDGRHYKLSARVVIDPMATRNTETRLECYRRPGEMESPNDERALARSKKDVTGSPKHDIELDAELTMLQDQLQKLKKERKILKTKKKLKKELEKKRKDELELKAIKVNSDEAPESSTSKRKPLWEAGESRRSRSRKRRKTSSTSPPSSNKKSKKRKTSPISKPKTPELTHKDTTRRSLSKNCSKSCSTGCRCKSCSKRKSSSSSSPSDSSRKRSPRRSRILRSPLHKSSREAPRSRTPRKSPYRQDSSQKSTYKQPFRSPSRKSSYRRISPHSRTPLQKSPYRRVFPPSRSPRKSPYRRVSPPSRSPPRKSPYRRVSPRSRSPPQKSFYRRVSPPSRSPPRKSPYRRVSPPSRSPPRKSPYRRVSPRSRSPPQKSPYRRVSPRSPSPPRKSPYRRVSPRSRSPPRKSPYRRVSPRSRSPSRKPPYRRISTRQSPLRYSPSRRSPDRRKSPKTSPLHKSVRHYTPPRKSSSRNRSPRPYSPNYNFRRFLRASVSPYSRRRSPRGPSSPQRISTYKSCSPRRSLEDTLPRKSHLKHRSPSPYSAYKFESTFRSSRRCSPIDTSPYGRYSPTRSFDRSRYSPSDRIYGEYNGRPAQWRLKSPYSSNNEVVYVNRDGIDYDVPSTSKVHYEPSDKYDDQTQAFDGKPGARIIELGDNHLNGADAKSWREVDEVVENADLEDEKSNSSNDVNDSSPDVERINLIISMNVVKNTNSAKTNVASPKDNNSENFEDKETENNTINEAESRNEQNSEEVKTEKIDCDDQTQNETETSNSVTIKKESIEENTTTIKKENVNNISEIIDICSNSEDEAPDIVNKVNSAPVNIVKEANQYQNKPFDKKVHTSPKFVMPIIKLLKQMKECTKNIDENIKKNLIYVVKLKLRDRLKEIMKDVNVYISSQAICKLYRSQYSLAQDKEFIAHTLKDIESGMYNNLLIRLKEQKSTKPKAPIPKPPKIGSGLKQIIEYLKDLGKENVNGVNDVSTTEMIECQKSNTTELVEDNVDNILQNKTDDDVVFLENKCDVIEISDSEDERENTVPLNTENTIPLKGQCLNEQTDQNMEDGDKTVKIKIEDVGASRNVELSKRKDHEKSSLDTDNSFKSKTATNVKHSGNYNNKSKKIITNDKIQNKKLALRENNIRIDNIQGGIKKNETSHVERTKDTNNCKSTNVTEPKTNVLVTNVDSTEIKVESLLYFDEVIQGYSNLNDQVKLEPVYEKNTSRLADKSLSLVPSNNTNYIKTVDGSHIRSANVLEAEDEHTVKSELSDENQQKSAEPSNNQENGKANDDKNTDNESESVKVESADTDECIESIENFIALITKTITIS
ncbi:E3 ubiquitin-protein ligase RBBP6-like isoform X2 [Pectinophora gossypiella]|uniref:E3 ubiquitin-protein ligase RBBP6-like isoform X2 n=1 Tax=Pectinophora gossypiella TaxID=13191 RepID=UPI00214F0D08|nr:E3 ubiquitin-protein ligase RBBP6-like isoform X2 [Pectinophora gossypiella]